MHIFHQTTNCRAVGLPPLCAQHPAAKGQTIARLIVPARIDAPILVCTEGLSFWGGVDANTGVIIDAHHPQHGQSLAGQVVMMPTSRGSCSGSGVLLELALNGHAPAAFVFREDEDILTLGALIATTMFHQSIAVVQLDAEDYARLATKTRAKISQSEIWANGLSFPVETLSASDLSLSATDRAMLSGTDGPAVKLAMETLCTMAAAQGATRLTDVTRAHIDGCIYASPANLTFAKTMVEMNAQVRIPTSMNAISVDHQNWRTQDVAPNFGLPASQLADAYVQMGASPSFTCAPYLLNDPPQTGEDIGWSESNAVIFANTVLGARTVKHPDFLDLFIALTGRAPYSGVYLAENRLARRVIHVTLPQHYDDSFWPLLGWSTGQIAPDCIPVLTGLENTTPSQNDLKALCAAFGTTSAAPMLHIAGVTPEADIPPATGADQARLTPETLAQAWRALNSGGIKIDLVALGSPHFSLSETRQFAALMTGHTCHPDTAAIITLGRETHAAAKAEALDETLSDAGVQIIADLCWCSISEPVFPPNAKNLMTNSGKYAHYAPGLSGRDVRFGSLAACAQAARTGSAPKYLPDWLQTTPA